MTPQIPAARIWAILNDALADYPNNHVPDAFAGVSEIGIQFDEGMEERSFRLVVKSITSDARFAGQQVGRYRFQLTGIEGRTPEDVDSLLGVYDEGPAPVLVLVDPVRHLPVKGESNSVQFPRGLLESAHREQRVVAIDHKGEEFIALPHERLVDALLGTRRGLEILARMPAAQAELRRERVFRNVRDHCFRDRVLELDGHACVACGLQLGVVEGAHIIAHADSRDDRTENGLSLCPNHHAAYDHARLISYDGTGLLHVNVARIEELRERHRLGETERLLDSLHPQIDTLSACRAAQFAKRFALDQEQGEWRAYDRWSSSAEKRKP
jgi:putative restriction endonuclease